MVAISGGGCGENAVRQVDQTDDVCLHPRIHCVRAVLIWDPTVWTRGSTAHCSDAIPSSQNREAQLAKKREDLQEKLVKFYKFIQENEIKKNRYVEKVVFDFPIIVWCMV